MIVDLCDGLPVHFSPDSTGDDTTRNCTTQSIGNIGDYPDLDAFSNTATAFQLAETSQPPPPSDFPSAICTASQTYPPPYTHSAASTCGMWPTPPSTAGEDFEDYTYNASPTSASCGAHLATSSARSSVASPSSWSSPEPQHLAFQQVVWPGQEPLSPFSVHIHSNPTEGHPRPQMMSHPYPNQAYLARSMNSDVLMTTDTRGTTPDHVRFVPSDGSSSPVPKVEYGEDYLPDGEKTVLQTGQATAAPNGKGSSKMDEPYAQLIYKALMSNGDHSMTLQEIYQWFRDNTDKTTPDKENKGWQNSIRHNLSMNGAFVKREKKPSPTTPLTDTGEPKKSNEWVLTDEAITEGVESTTRYRKNTTRRGGSGSYSRSNHNNPLSARASSGRKGGITASKTRSANNRAAARRQHYGELMASQLPSSSLVQDHDYYSRHASIGMPDPQGGGPGGGQGYYFGPGQPQHQLLHQPNPHSQLDPNTYSLEDVTGVYEAPLAPQASSDPSQLSSHLPQSFSNLFIDDIGQTAATSSAHLHYNWADGSQFQQ
ncbi:hypothetical protein JX266_011607 [Neoarthrinium moseri]|nr:hypothetical protein JX266_011607 [Neoarthrinium moseri]